MKAFVCSLRKKWGFHREEKKASHLTSLAQIFPILPLEPDHAGDSLYLLSEQSSPITLRRKKPARIPTRSGQQSRTAKSLSHKRLLKAKLSITKQRPREPQTGSDSFCAPALLITRRPEVGQIQVNLQNSTSVHAC